MQCLANAIEPLRAANQVAGRPVYDWYLVSPDLASVRSSSGLDLKPHLRADNMGELPRIDRLAVISGFNYRRHTTRRLVTQIRMQHRRVDSLMGLDTGAYALAKAGLLEGHRVTLHWQEKDLFEEEFLDLDVTADRYVMDGSVLTAGGATTTMDLMLALIRQDAGEAVALGVANIFIYDSERSATIPQTGDADSSLAKRFPQVAAAISQMETHLEEPLSIPQIAERSGIGQRDLERSFQQALKTTAKRYYQHLRLMRARQLLAETRLSMAEIAARTGYSAAAILSRAFREHFKITPREWRKQASGF